MTHWNKNDLILLGYNLKKGCSMRDIHKKNDCLLQV